MNLSTDQTNNLKNYAVNSNNALSVANVSDLRFVDKTNIKVVFTLGYYAAADGGCSMYMLDALDNTSANNGGSIIAANDGGRWKIIQHGPMSSRQWGVRHDGVTDDAAALNQAIGFTPLGEQLLLDCGPIRVSTTIMVNGGRTLSGRSRNAGAAKMPFPAGNSYCTIMGDLGVSPVVATTGTFNVNSVTLENFSISRATGAFSSTAIGLQLNGVDQTLVRNVNVFRHGVGFDLQGQLSPYLEHCNSWCVTDACSHYILR